MADERTVSIRCTGAETRTLDQLQPFQGDLKRLSADNAAKLRKEIIELGFSEPVSVWQDNGTSHILNGHQRVVVLKMMEAEGWMVPPLPCSLVEADSLDQAKRKVLALTSQYGEITEEGLTGFLEELDITLDEVGESFRFPEINLEALRPDPDIEEGPVPLPPGAPITAEAERIVLGRHVLLCGDAGRTEDVDRLLDGERIHLVNMDPPYNVMVEPASGGADTGGQRPSWRPSEGMKKDNVPRPARGGYRRDQVAPGQIKAKGRRLHGDFMTDDEFESAVRLWFGNAAHALLPGRAFYIWGGGYPAAAGSKANSELFPVVLREAGMTFSQLVIWDKGSGVINRKDFMGQYEVCFYGWREGAAHQFLGPNNITDIWGVKKVTHSAMVHLTEKPVELAARAMQYSSHRGENVLDLFGGSGSTLIAAEQMGRRAFLMEIDRLYCDVIVRRYYNLVGWDKAPAEHRERWEMKDA